MKDLRCLECGRDTADDPIRYTGPSGEVACSYCVYPIPPDPHWTNRTMLDPLRAMAKKTDETYRKNQAELEKRRPPHEGPTLGGAVLAVANAVGQKANEIADNYLAMQAQVKFLEGRCVQLEQENQRLTALLNTVLARGVG